MIVTSTNKDLLSKLFFKIEFPVLPKGFYWCQDAKNLILKNIEIKFSIFYLNNLVYNDHRLLRGIDRYFIDKYNSPEYSKFSLHEASKINQIDIVKVWPYRVITMIDCFEDLYNTKFDLNVSTDITLEKETLENLIYHGCEYDFSELKFTMADVKMTLFSNIDNKITIYEQNF